MTNSCNGGCGKGFDEAVKLSPGEGIGQVGDRILDSGILDLPGSFAHVNRSFHEPTGSERVSEGARETICQLVEDGYVSPRIAAEYGVK
ncbi:MAG: hypothetical protein MRY79_02510 [Alphaproteobacteria bacterium]|nr:hypothetical protein [Alphaproteobacteria bacterium]